MNVEQRVSLEDMNQDFKVDKDFQKIQSDIVSKTLAELNERLDQLLVEGLKRKGFVFSTKVKLERFIKNRCRVEEYTVSNQKLFYVNDKPFLIYDMKIEPNITSLDKQTVLKASAGAYQFL